VLVRVALVSRFLIVTVTPGRGAPDGSVTTPERTLDTWAVAETAKKRHGISGRSKCMMGSSNERF
jgi:hypothetical protein